MSEQKPDQAESTQPVAATPVPATIPAVVAESSAPEKENEVVEHGFIPNPNARRQGQERKKLAFLDNYNKFVTPAHTAQAIGVSVRTFYDWCKDDANFNAAFQVVDKHLTDRLIRIALSRAFRGSDNLLMFMLKARDGRFREKIAAEINQADIERIVSTLVAALRKSIPDTCPHCKVNLNLSAKVENMLASLSKGTQPT